VVAAASEFCCDVAVAAGSGGGIVFFSVVGASGLLAPSIFKKFLLIKLWHKISKVIDTDAKHNIKEKGKEKGKEEGSREGRTQQRSKKRQTINEERGGKGKGNPKTTRPIEFHLMSRNHWETNYS
jgi:hypothetical protein